MEASSKAAKDFKRIAKLSQISRRNSKLRFFFQGSLERISK